MIPSTSFGVVTLITTSQISSAITRAYEELIIENNLEGLPPMEPVLCWVVVDPQDPGFANPSKPVGPQLSEDEVAALVRSHPECRFIDYGEGKRRVIASPQPQKILNLQDVQEVIADGKVPVALGGGGIPTLLDRFDRREIANGILDKDLSSALLASNVAADTFLILTSEQGVFTGYKTSSQRFHPHLSASQAERWLHQGEFPPGSMGPKINGALQFLAANPDGSVIIGHVEEHVEKLLNGSRGTTITAG
jgi:carbamate kinase